MNPVAVALERAAAVATDSASLATVFAREWDALECAPEARAVVLGVGAAEARQWVAGQIGDLALILSVRNPPEAIYWPSLPRLDTYRAGLRTARQLWHQGARFTVFISQHPVVLRHLARHGFREASRLGPGRRMIGDAAATRRFLFRQ